MLPKIEYPVYQIKIPSIKKKSNFRPFLVKEEKLLLMAKESDKSTDMLSAIKQVINNCSLDQKFNVNKLTTFDIEYIFIKLRAVSVDNMVKVSYKDFEDNKLYDFEIDLNTIEVQFPEKISNSIEINADSGIMMKYPSASLYDDKEFLSADKNQYFELILRCIDKVYFKDQIYDVSEYTKEELTEFLESLSLKTFEKVQEFLLNAPKINYEINYTNTLGSKRTITLNSLNDFFSWR